MGIKWKDKIIVVLWSLLFTFGVMGVLSGLNNGSQYIKRDYFKTQQFESQLNQFIDYLSMFELNYLTKEEANKNTTKYELSENIDELFERFKRGDTSRHTEGSGLGLAIAKSIVDLHEGSLDIGVDGDLFKVTITLDRLP